MGNPLVKKTAIGKSLVKIAKGNSLVIKMAMGKSLVKNSHREFFGKKWPWANLQ